MKTYEVYLYTKVVQMRKVKANNADQAIEKAKELGIEQGGEDQEYEAIEIEEDYI